MAEAVVNGFEAAAIIVGLAAWGVFLGTLLAVSVAELGSAVQRWRKAL